MAHDPISTTPVHLVRLAPGVAEVQCEETLCRLAPALSGSLLTWLHDDWYALAPDVVPAIERTHADAHGAMRKAGVAGVRTTDVDGLRQMLTMRTPSSPDQAVPSAAAAGVQCEAPRFSCEAKYQGRTVQADWHLDAAGVLAAWPVLPGDGPAAIGAVKVAHIDTGYTLHPALGWGVPGGPWVHVDEGVNLWRERVPGAGGSAEIGTWDSGPNEYPEPRDNLTGPNGGHGTRTASTIAGLFVPDDGTPFPFFGAAPGASIVPYRVADCVLVDHITDLLARAIDDAVAKGCRVINISLGSIFPSLKVARAIDAAYEAGTIVCAAAGNIGHEVVYPGRFNRVITMGGATTGDGELLRPWSGASRGAYVDVCAPADHIRRASTVVDRRGTERRLIEDGGDGTSYATAIGTGIAVLWLASRGAELERAYGSARWAWPAAFKRLARATASKPESWDHEAYGAGVIHAGRLLEADLPPLASLHHESEAWEPLDTAA